MSWHLQNQWDKSSLFVNKIFINDSFLWINFHLLLCVNKILPEHLQAKSRMGLLTQILNAYKYNERIRSLSPFIKHHWCFVIAEIMVKHSNTSPAKAGCIFWRRARPHLCTDPWNGPHNTLRLTRKRKRKAQYEPRQAGQSLCNGPTLLHTKSLKPNLILQLLIRIYGWKSKY